MLCNSDAIGSISVKDREIIVFVGVNDHEDNASICCPVVAS